MTRKIFIGLTLLLFGSVVASAATKMETELRLGLTKTQYDAMLVKFKSHKDVKESNRTDTYFEIYDHEIFLLQSAEKGWKWRMMEKVDKAEWQISELVDERKLTENEKFPSLKITVRRKRDGKIEAEAVKGIQEVAKTFFKELKDKETVGKCTLHSDELLRKLFVDIFDAKPSSKDFKKWLDDKHGDVVPVGVTPNKLFRVLIVLESGVKIETTLGLATRMNVKGEPVEVPEVEGEMLTEIDKKKWTDVGKEWTNYLVEHFDLKPEECPEYPGLTAYVAAKLKE